MTNVEFKEKCLKDDKFIKEQKKRNTSHPFTELELWEGASQGLECFNQHTNQWVEIFPPSM